MFWIELFRIDAFLDQNEKNINESWNFDPNKQYLRNLGLSNVEDGSEPQQKVFFK